MGACLLIFIAHLVPYETSDEAEGEKLAGKAGYEAPAPDDASLQPTTSLLGDESFLSFRWHENRAGDGQDSTEIVIDFEGEGAAEGASDGFTSPQGMMSPGRFVEGGYHVGKVSAGDEDTDQQRIE